MPFSAMGWIESIAFHHRHDKERKERLVLRPSFTSSAFTPGFYQQALAYVVIGLRDLQLLLCDAVDCVRGSRKLPMQSLH